MGQFYSEAADPGAGLADAQQDHANGMIFTEGNLRGVEVDVVLLDVVPEVERIQLNRHPITRIACIKDVDQGIKRDVGRRLDANSCI
jgi:hypothetical protein